jgi:hypothetical protein
MRTGGLRQALEIAREAAPIKTDRGVWKKRGGVLAAARSRDRTRSVLGRKWWADVDLAVLGKDPL